MNFLLNIDDKNDLVGIIFLSRLFKEPNKERCKYFDKYLIDNYGDAMKELISQIYNINCPLSLRVKFWLRAYTLETKFYKDMNSDLMKDKLKPYIPYIQLLYSGLMMNNFHFSYFLNLFRGALIKKEEINNLINLFEKSKVSADPCVLIYSKAFMSFSLDYDVAMNYMNSKEPTEKEERVLYILESDELRCVKNATNAYLRDISFFEDEEEVLVFPFSFYEISNIQKKIIII